jgi:hypothetical protein
VRQSLIRLFEKFNYFLKCSKHSCWTCPGTLQWKLLTRFK